MIAATIPEVTAMHDPTEGGVANAIYEMTSASKKGFILNSESITVRDDTNRICHHYGISPLDLISSGALLLTVKPEGLEPLLTKFKEANIPASEIGIIIDEQKHIIQMKDSTGVSKPNNLRRPVQDALWDILKPN